MGHFKLIADTFSAIARSLLVAVLLALVFEKPEAVSGGTLILLTVCAVNAQALAHFFLEASL